MTNRQFYVADGSLSTPVTAASLAATSIGGTSTIVTTALVYQYGLAGLWMEIGGVVGFLLLGLFISTRVRRSGVSSIAELLGLRYGANVRKTAALLIVFAEFAWFALLLKASAALLAPLLPFSEATLLMGSAIVILLYTIVGGQFAVAYSDLIQLILMLASIAMLLPLMLYRNGSIATFAWPSFHLITEGLGAFKALNYFLLFGLSHLIGSDIYAKLLSARSEKVARQGAFYAAIIKSLFAIAMASVGFYAKGHFQLSDPTRVLGFLIEHALSPLIGAFILVGLIATLMSSADQVLLSALTMIDHDLFAKESKLRRYISAFMIALVGIGLALASSSAISAMQFSYTLFVSSLGAAVLLGVFNPDVDIPAKGLVLSMIMGGLTSVILHLLKFYVFLPFSPMIGGLLINLFMLSLSIRLKDN